MSDFVIPRGKYKGRRLSELSDQELHLSWAGFNGSGAGADIAVVLSAEITRRKASGERKTMPSSVTVAPVATEAKAGWPRVEKRGKATITYHTPAYRSIEGADPLDYFPWPDGWGHPDNHDRSGLLPFDLWVA